MPTVLPTTRPATTARSTRPPVLNASLRMLTPAFANANRGTISIARPRVEQELIRSVSGTASSR